MRVAMKGKNSVNASKAFRGGECSVRHHMDGQPAMAAALQEESGRRVLQGLWSMTCAMTWWIR
jgi:hypothetical protein